MGGVRRGTATQIPRDPGQPRLRPTRGEDASVRVSFHLVSDFAAEGRVGSLDLDTATWDAGAHIVKPHLRTAAYITGRPACKQTRFAAYHHRLRSSDDPSRYTPTDDQLLGAPSEW